MGREGSSDADVCTFLCDKFQIQVCPHEQGKGLSQCRYFANKRRVGQICANIFYGVFMLGFLGFFTDIISIYFISPFQFMLSQLVNYILATHFQNIVFMPTL